MQRDLRRLAGGTDEQQDANEVGRKRRGRTGGERGLHAVELERAERVVEQEHAEQEAGVADAVGDEGLLAGARVGQVFEPEADEQVRRKADTFPADEAHQQRATEYQQQHEEQEQVEVREVARVARVVLHVAG